MKMMREGGEKGSHSLGTEPTAALPVGRGRVAFVVAVLVKMDGSCVRLLLLLCHFPLLPFASILAQPFLKFLRDVRLSGGRDERLRCAFLHRNNHRRHHQPLHSHSMRAKAMPTQRKRLRRRGNKATLTPSRANARRLAEVI